jgi:hypothetical protein
MAQVILSRAGAALGSRAAPAVLRTLGRRLGRAVGSAIGARIDDALWGETRRIEGARLTDAHVMASEEGASIPLVFGRARIAGQVIWAARFRETRATETTGGGKSGRARTEKATYAYSCSFAVGLCTGAIVRIERAWANGREFDLSTVVHRVHVGAEDQAPDPVIEAVEGGDATPAYRGLAYIVFEDLPLAPFGDALPQLSFEIVRAPSAAGPRLESLAKAVCLIPGAGEFALATDAVRRVIAAGEETSENAHAEEDRANLLVSLNRLQQDLPNVATVSLVSAWFGDDLRCGQCTIKPGVEIAAKETRPLAWRAGGLDRAAARLISTSNGGPAYGGTPADAAVLQAIAELKARGLAVGLNPFLLMDVPTANTLPDPYGAGAQAAYPWRGRVTCMPAQGRSGTPDKTSAATAQVDAFFGAVTGAQFVTSGGDVVCTAPDWKYRQFILHHAHLAALAGGVDFFVIGSELRGVTTVRNSATNFPAVAHLIALAAQVRAILPTTKIVYAADWSEYAGHHPQDGTGDVFFHLDPLWADDNIAAVAVNWYPPLTDWRDGDGHADLALASTDHDAAYLAARIEAGEAFDWFYADDAARAAQARTAITDGAYGKPWVFRAKDLRSFWSEAHYDRPGGAENATPTAWTPKSKPIWLLELGVPAIEKGANAPNVFLDPKSSESAAPPFSAKTRDDLIQRRALEAYLSYWDDPAHNPVSPLTGARMIDASRTCLWAWDARPFPQFPARDDLWSDGPAWHRGHWLNGRAGAATLAEVVLDLAARAGVEVNASGLSGIVSGYIVDAPTTLRAALEPLMALWRFDVREEGGVLVCRHLDDAEPFELEADECVAEPTRRPFLRSDVADAPLEARIRYIDGAADYRIAMASARRRDALGEGVLTLDAPAVLDETQALGVAEAALAEARAAREGAMLAVAATRLDLEPGDTVDLAALGAGLYRIARIIDEDGARTLTLIGASTARMTPAGADVRAPAPAPVSSRPNLVVLDLPPLFADQEADGPRAAVRATPWRGPVTVHAGATRAGATARGVAALPAAIGELVWPLYPGPLGRWDEGNVTRVHLPGANLQSVNELTLLAGANPFAVAQPDGGWEIVQARSATLVAPDTWELRGLLRGLQGSETAATAPAGAPVVLLDEALARLEIAAHERGAALVAVAAPAGFPASDGNAAERGFTFADVWARPFAPVHLAARRVPGGDIVLSWIRRARLGGDAWAGEPPLGEEREAWRVEILSGTTLKRVLETTTTAATYASADQTADFGTLPALLTVRIAQVSARGGLSRAREATLQP